MYKISMVSLGCPKNQVDAEMMLATLKTAGFEIGAPEAEADAIIINTCGFIEDAKKEAAAKISKISDNITKENKIETLVTAKGINNCIAIINDDGTKVDIIVDVKDLNDTIILQIKDIATSQMNCSFEDVTIIQSK